jgi:hypothetical protein
MSFAQTQTPTVDRAIQRRSVLDTFFPWLLIVLALATGALVGSAIMKAKEKEKTT